MSPITVAVRRCLLGGNVFNNPFSYPGLAYYPDVDTGCYADGAADFSSADKEYLTVADNATLSATTVLEVGGAVYLASVGAVRPFIIKGTSITTAANLEYALYYDHTGTNFKFSVSNGSTITTVTDTGTAPSIATWYSLRAGLKSDGTLFISRNNATEITSASCPNIQDSTNALVFGYESANGYYMNGRLDSFYVTKTISSSAEATALYNAGAGRIYSDLVAGNGLGTFATNLISWWNFNEEPGIRYDQKGANHLTPASVQLITATTLNGGFETLGTNGGTKFNVSTVNVARTSNVATIEATAHGLASTNVVTITLCTDTTFNGTNKTATVVDVDHFTYVSTGDDKVETADTAGRIATDVFGSWTESGAGTSTVNLETVAPYAGTYAARLDIDAGNDIAYVSQGGITTIGRKYKTTVYAKAASGTPSVFIGDTANAGTIHTLTTSYAQYTGYFTTTTATFLVKRSTATSNSVYVDNITLESLGPMSNAGIAAGVTIDGNFCGQFNGTSQYMSVADNASLSVANVDFTIAGWVNLDSKATGYSGIASKTVGGTAATEEYGLYYSKSSDAFRFVISDGSTAGTISATTFGPPPVGNWYYIIAWHDATANTINIMVNNGTADSLAWTTGCQDSNGAFEIGRSFGSNSYELAGRIDGVAFWKRTLTAAEKTYLFNNGKGLKYAGIGVAGTDGSDLKTSLSSWWGLGKTEGGLTQDSHSTNTLTNNGTVTNGQGVNYYEGVVAKITDQSISGYNFTQTTQSKRPSWQSNIANGKALLYFDGVDDTLSNAADVIGTGDVTVFAVIKPIGWGGTNVGRIIGNGQFFIAVTNSNSRLYASSDNSVTTAFSANSSIALSTSYVVAVTRTSAGVANIYINGTLSGTADQASGTPAAGSPTYIGNRAAFDRAFDGYLGLMGVYNSILTVAQINSISNFLKSYYQI